MKKLFILGICLFIFMIAPNVEAKEYYTDTIYDEIGANNSFTLNVGDVIHHLKNSVDYSKFGGTDLGTIRIYIDGEYFNDFLFVTADDFDYEIRSYEEITDTSLPENKKVNIRGNITTDCAYSILDIYYTLEDDVQKKVVYYNVYDAENNNPTSYYEGETDILLKDISRDGYKFLGWYTSPNFEEDTRVTMITSDEPGVLNLYAKWEKIEVSEDTFTNSNTNSMFYIAIGIGFILILGTAIVIVYKYKKL